MLVRRRLEATTRLVVANNNQEEEEDDEEEDEQELKLDLKLEPEDQFNNHQQLNAASSRPTMNNWRTRRRTRNNNSSGETTVSFSQSVTRTQSRHRHRHGSPSQRDASKAKLALAIFLCLASVISLASSNYAPQANDETASQCGKDSDCGDMRCYQGKCMCKKEQPIEHRDLCLPLSVVGEGCTISEQCMGNSVCLDSLCSCGANAISLFNPSAKIYYCHPKRRLREECGHDLQCPGNSFCSTNKCLCQNGYGPVTVKNTDGAETAECLPKSCSSSRDCESEYHVCEDNMCICLADHFDPHTAECYKFGSTGGNKSNANNQTANAKGSSHDGGGHPDNANNNKGFNSILKDLMNNSDKLWYVIIILVLLTIILLALIVMSVRRYFLGYCWTAHKKEYEPNNRSAPKGGYFNKDSINNKSFRQKKGGEMDNDDDDDCDDNDDTAADRSNLVTTTTPTTTTVNKSCGAALLNNGHRRPIVNQNNNNSSTNKQPTKLAASADTENRYVKVDMRTASAAHEDQAYEQADPTNVHYQPYHQQLLTRPLSTSNSTAV